MTDGYLSRDRAHLAKNQRQRRARLVRVDYMPSRAAQAIIAIKRKQCRPGSVSATNSAVIDAILTEWANMTGIKYAEIEAPRSSGEIPELTDAYARTYDFGKTASESPAASRALAKRSECGANGIVTAIRAGQGQSQASAGADSTEGDRPARGRRKAKLGL